MGCQKTDEVKKIIKKKVFFFPTMSTTPFDAGAGSSAGSGFDKDPLGRSALVWRNIDSSSQGVTNAAVKLAINTYDIDESTIPQLDYNSTSGEITIPKAGRYWFQFQGTITVAGGSERVWIYANWNGTGTGYINHTIYEGTFAASDAPIVSGCVLVPVPLDNMKWTVFVKGVTGGRATLTTSATPSDLNSVPTLRITAMSTHDFDPLT